MKARRKIPDGHRDTSPRSSPSKRTTLIFVFAEMDDKVIFRRSRSRRRRLPKDSSVTTLPRLMLEQPRPAHRQVLSDARRRKSGHRSADDEHDADENHERTHHQDAGHFWNH